ncbi:hypothetical protein DNTS_018991, partial [Danionella cerebrum]
ESVLSFLLENGGRVKNKLLVAHFKPFLSSESNRREKRERFKSFVDNVAYVRQEDGEKVVCLKKKYRLQETRCGISLQDGAGDAELTAEDEEPELEKGGDEQDGQTDVIQDAEEKDDLHYDSQVPDIKVDHKSEEVEKLHKQPEMYEEVHDELEVLEKTHQNPEEESEVNKMGLHKVSEGVVNQETSEQKRNAHDELIEMESTTGGDHICVSDIILMDSSPQSSRSDPELFPLRGSRRSSRHLLISTSPQVFLGFNVRCSGIHRSSRSLQSLRSSVFRSSSSSVDEECVECLTLEPLEHQWMLSSAGGDWSSLQLLLLCDPALFSKRDFITGFTCLHWAAKHGKQELIVRLCNFAKENNVAININARSSAGYTPLHLATMHGHTEVMKLLIGAYDADVELRDFNGKKASHYLKSSSSEEIMDIIGVTESLSSENISGSGRWKLPKVLQSNLNPLRLLNTSEESGAEPKLKALGRKSSMSRIRKQGKRVGTRIVHSASFRERQEQQGAPQSPARTRPASDLFT